MILDTPTKKVPISRMIREWESLLFTLNTITYSSLIITAIHAFMYELHANCEVCNTTVLLKISGLKFNKQINSWGQSLLTVNTQNG